MKISLRVAAVLVAMLGSCTGILAGKADAPRRIEIAASKFSYSPSEITLKKGETVVLVLSSADVTHGLKIKEFGIKVEAKKGHPEEVTLTPTETGHFEGKCSHFCGKGHGSMTLEINVVE
jgi:cytochrome c oxidase subunit II